MRDMPDMATKEQVEHPLLGDGGLKRTDIRKYLPSTRRDHAASWDQTKSAAEVAELRATGGFVDLMQWRAHRSNPVAVIREENAVPYEPEDWKQGDVLPGRLLSRADAKGSAADNDAIKGVWENGTWTVLWAQKMNTGHPEDDKILEEGKSCTFGFAVHDDNVTTRFHFVALPIEIGFGSKTGLQATKF